MKLIYVQISAEKISSEKDHLIDPGVDGYTSNIKVDLRGIECEVVNWIELSQNRIYW